MRTTSVCLLLAPGRGFSASSVNYGTAPKYAYAQSFLTGACPIVASYGAKDRTLRGAADRLERALTAVGVDHDVKEYPEAGHAFLNDLPPSAQPLRKRNLSSTLASYGRRVVRWRMLLWWLGLMGRRLGVRGATDPEFTARRPRFERNKRLSK